MKLQTIFTTALAVAALGLSTISAAETGGENGKFGVNNGVGWVQNTSNQLMYNHLRDCPCWPQAKNWSGGYFVTPSKGAYKALGNSNAISSGALGNYAVIAPVGLQ